MRVVAILRRKAISPDGSSDVYYETKTFDGQTPIKGVFDWAEKRLDRRAENYPDRYQAVLGHRLEITIDQSSLNEHEYVDDLPF